MGVAHKVEWMLQIPEIRSLNLDQCDKISLCETYDRSLMIKRTNFDRCSGIISYLEVLDSNPVLGTL